MRAAEIQPARRLEERLRAARDRTFVGRSAELDMFRTALTTDGSGFTVLYLHGPGGIGKSTLLQRMADEAVDTGRVVVQIDCSTIGSPAQFESEASAALRDERAVVLVDSVDGWGVGQGWLCDQFLPRLSVDVVVVLAGRQPPDPQYWSDPGWSEALRVIGLRDLPRSDAVELLRTHGVAPALFATLLASVGGHPLALRLAAEAALDAPPDTRHWTLPREITDALLTQLVGQPPSERHRQALEVCALAMTTTQDLLRAVLPDPDDAPAMFDWLRGLPFTEPDRQGLRPHSLVRELLDRDFRWRDPQGYRSMQTRVRASLVDRALRSDEPDVLPVVAALHYLHRRETLPGYVTWTGESGVVEDVLRPGDAEHVVRMTAACEGEWSASIAAFWLDRQPEAFRVARRPDGGPPIAFMAWLTLHTPDPRELSADPVVAACWAHARATAPLRAGEHIAVARFCVDPSAYGRPSAATELFQLRVTAGWLRQNRMAWSYVVIPDPAFWGQLMSRLDQTVVSPAVRIGERSYTLYTHDWRAGPVNVWLERTGDLLHYGSEAVPSSSASGADELTVLSQQDFFAAVRDALRHWRQPARFAENPLRFSRLASDSDPNDRIAGLRGAVLDAVETLQDAPRSEKAYRALAVTFIQGAPTQQAAARRLRLPFSTYRRHLATGVQLVCEHLWERELRGSGANGGNGGNGTGGVINHTHV